MQWTKESSHNNNRTIPKFQPFQPTSFTLRPRPSAVYTPSFTVDSAPRPLSKLLSSQPLQPRSLQATMGKEGRRRRRCAENWQRPKPAESSALLSWNCQCCQTHQHKKIRCFNLRLKITFYHINLHK